MLLVNGANLDRWKALDDEQVVAEVLQGQTSLFEVLMRRHNERVYRAARAILHDEGEAEEAMQQGYVNAYAHLHQFDRRARFSTWLTRIVVNEALARARRRAQWRPYDEEDRGMDNVRPPSSQDNPERHTFGRELRLMLEDAVDSLPDGLREVFVLRLVEGQSTAETAACLGLTEDVVKTRLTRARAKLRADVTKSLGDVTPEIFRFLRPRCDRVVAAVLVRIA
jgi:RNA polymerase sigma-70 factor (ECF subfamily)